MRILLSSGDVIFPERRQQITPDMKFTCDGTITKWIIGAHWTWFYDNILYPELQLWRKNGNNTYQKISGTLISIGTRSDDGVYEYDNFPPIPFQAGDILGVFIPQQWDRKLEPGSEDGHGPTNYYFETEYDVNVSPYETINLDQNIPQIQSDVNHPLVTVEISECTKSLIFTNIKFGGIN